MNTPNLPNRRPFRLARLTVLALVALAFASRPQQAFAEANYVYHERTSADPGCGGQYVTTLNPTSAETYPLRFKVEYQFYTDNVRVYYTTDGSTPAGSFGTPSGTTAVVSGAYDCTFGGPLVDVITATIPAQSAGTVVKYIVSAWNSGGGAEIFANGPGAPCGCGTPTSSSALATVFQYTVGSTTNLYWDPNGATAGAGATPNGTWGTNNAVWSTVVDGTASLTNWITTRNAIFSAGTDGTGAYTVALFGSQPAASLTIEEGTMSLLASNAIVLGAGPVTINSGAALVVDTSARVSQTAGSIWTLNGGTIRNENTGVGGSFVDVDSTITLGASGGTLSKTFPNVLTIVETGSVISGNGSLTKTGVGVVALASSNIYSGATIINDGELRIRTTPHRLPRTTAVTINHPGKLNLNGVAQEIGSLSGNGGVGFAGATLTINGSADTVFSGVMANTNHHGAGAATSGAGRISKNGTGSITFTGTNTITGSITNILGSINVSNGAVLCDATLDMFIIGGSINMSNTAQTVLSLAGPGGSLNLGSGHTFTVNPTSGTKSYYGNITGPGALTKTGAGVLGLGGSSTFTGNVAVNVGKILVLSANALGSTSGDTTVAGGAELLFDGATNIFTIAEPIKIAAAGADGGAIAVQNSANITLSGPITLTADATNTVSGSATVVYNNANSFTSLANQNLTLQGGGLTTGSGGTISGTIALGTGSLTKLQGGRWILSGSNSYSGGTFVNAGTLQVANTTGSGTGSGAVTVAVGATLSGTGIIEGPVTVNGTFAPGASIGTLAISNTLTLASNTVIEVNKSLGQTSDKVVGITTFTAGGKLVVSTNVAVVGDILVAGDTFPVFSATTYLGAFTSITPATPGPGLAWDAAALTNSGTLTVHANPVAVADVASAQHGQTTTIPVVKLLTNDTGELGETLSVTAVSANASLGGGLVTYTAPLTGTSDTITYTLSDGRGGTNTGTINVTLTSSGGSFNQLAAVLLGGGDMELTYLGIPGTNYALDRSFNLTPPVTWVPQITNPAAGNGYLIFTNTPDPSTNNFWRTRYVP